MVVIKMEGEWKVEEERVFDGRSENFQALAEELFPRQSGRTLCEPLASTTQKNQKKFCNAENAVNITKRKLGFAKLLSL